MSGRSLHPMQLDQVVYYLPPRVRNTYLIAGGLGAIIIFICIVQFIIIWLPLGPSFPGAIQALFGAILLLGLLALFACINVCVNAVTTRLTLAPQTVAYVTFWYRVTTTWQNIERLGIVQIGGGIGEVLVLRTPVTPTGWLPAYAALFQGDRIIPISSFGKVRGESPLANDLKRVAPQLFDTPHA